MGNAIFGWVNAAKTAVLSSTSAEPTLPVTNLANDQGNAASAWQTLNTVTAATLTITPAARTTFRAFGVFRTNLGSAGTATFRAFTNPGLVQVYSSGAVSVVNGQAVAVAPADTPADVVTIALSDAGNADAHLNVPLAFAGPAWQPLTGLSWQTTIGRDEVSDATVTRGGQTYVDLRATFRRLELALDGIRTTEAYAQVDTLDRLSRSGGNVLVIPSIANGFMQNEATFGILKATADVTFPLNVDARRSWRARLTERL